MQKGVAFGKQGIRTCEVASDTGARYHATAMKNGVVCNTHICKQSTHVRDSIGHSAQDTRMHGTQAPAGEQGETLLHAGHHRMLL